MILNTGLLAGFAVVLQNTYTGKLGNISVKLLVKAISFNIISNKKSFRAQKIRLNSTMFYEHA